MWGGHHHLHPLERRGDEARDPLDDTAAQPQPALQEAIHDVLRLRRLAVALARAHKVVVERQLRDCRADGASARTDARGDAGKDGAGEREGAKGKATPKVLGGLVEDALGGEEDEVLEAGADAGDELDGHRQHVDLEEQLVELPQQRPLVLGENLTLQQQQTGRRRGGRVAGWQGGRVAG